MELKEKMTKVFTSGYTISFNNEPRRKDGEWYNRIVWKHIELPANRVVRQCDWFGFEEVEDCVDDCLKYINTKK